MLAVEWFLERLGDGVLDEALLFASSDASSLWSLCRPRFSRIDDEVVLLDSFGWIGKWWWCEWFPCEMFTSFRRESSWSRLKYELFSEGSYAGVRSPTVTSDLMAVSEEARARRGCRGTQHAEALAAKHEFVALVADRGVLDVGRGQVVVEIGQVLGLDRDERADEKRDGQRGPELGHVAIRVDQRDNKPQLVDHSHLPCCSTTGSFLLLDVKDRELRFVSDLFLFRLDDDLDVCAIIFRELEDELVDRVSVPVANPDPELTMLPSEAKPVKEELSGRLLLLRNSCKFSGSQSNS
ncbi:hypothetical protein OGATHE_004843 [Ogataea polymorpha]|uniref:Uncharacterized protein n=1 Tax=Ogataea polymorpha TaxID=460523 RepID=A0A9P8P1V3_9ASCO|nr:hypothetical protein OGATHE_004843 [Ogataea polymorpha]